MATSNFKIDYHDGTPACNEEQFIYWEPSYDDWAGGYSAMQSVDDPDQPQVLMQLESSTDKLTELKTRYNWIEDVAGWDSRAVEAKSDKPTKAQKNKLPVYTLTKKIGKVKIILASGVNLALVKKAGSK